MQLIVAPVVRFLVTLALAACGGGDPGANKQPLDNFTAEQIYKRGEYELENGKRPKDAVHYFAEVERLYPYSDWAKRALIMQAFAYHKARQYDEARGAAQRFIDNYPGDEDAAYAQYLLALSSYDQIDEVGRDAVRFMMLYRKNDAPLDFDFAKVTEQSKDNPVFYVQYAHARLRSLARNAADLGVSAENPNYALLTTEQEGELIRTIGDFPRVVASAANLREPHRVARYLEELAGAYHRFYGACRILPVGDEEPGEADAASLARHHGDDPPGVGHCGDDVDGPQHPGVAAEAGGVDGRERPQRERNSGICR